MRHTVWALQPLRAHARAKAVKRACPPNPLSGPNPPRPFWPKLDRCPVSSVGFSALVDQAARSINLSCPTNAKAQTNSEFMINLKTATAVSSDVLVTLLRADEVIA